MWNNSSSCTISITSSRSLGLFPHLQNETELPTGLSSNLRSHQWQDSPLLYVSLGKKRTSNLVQAAAANFRSHPNFRDVKMWEKCVTKAQLNTTCHVGCCDGLKWDAISKMQDAGCSLCPFITSVGKTAEGRQGAGMAKIPSGEHFSFSHRCMFS